MRILVAISAPEKSPADIMRGDPDLGHLIPSLANRSSPPGGLAPARDA